MPKKWAFFFLALPFGEFPYSLTAFYAFFGGIYPSYSSFMSLGSFDYFLYSQLVYSRPTRPHRLKAYECWYYTTFLTAETLH